MKRLKAEQKRRIAGIIAIVLIVSMVLSTILPFFWYTTNAAESSEYTIEAVAGFDGYAKIGSLFPVNVNIRNNTEDTFKGEVYVNVLTSDYSSIFDEMYVCEYSAEINIPAGGTGQASFNVPSTSVKRSLDVKLRDGKKVVATESISLSVKSDTDIWVGLLSNSPEELTYLSPNYYSYTGDTVDMSGVVGTDFSAFGAFDAFVVNDFDFASLSEVQLRELLREVSSGDMLLIGGNSPIGSIDRLNLDSLNAVDRGLIQWGYMEDTKEYTTYPKGINIESLSGFSTFYALGNGYIVIVNDNLSNYNNLIDDDSFSSLLYTVYSRAMEDKSYRDIDSNLMGYTDRLPNLSDNMIGFIFIVLYFYVAFVLVIYFVLKKKDKREKGLKIIPATAVGLSLIIYLLSFNTVYKRPIASMVNYVDLRSAYGSSANIESYTNLITPYIGDIEIKPEEDATFLYLSDNSYNRYFDSYGGGYSYVTGGNGSIPYEIATSAVRLGEDGLTVEKMDTSKWENTYLAFEDTIETGEGFVNTFTLEEDILSGDITNNTNYDFVDAVLYVQIPGVGTVYVQSIGEMYRGDTATLENISPFDSDSLEYGEYSYILRNERRYSGNQEETYRKELEQDIFDGIISEISTTEGYPTGNYVTVGIAAFTADPIYGSDLRVNNRMVNISPITVFRDEVMLFRDVEETQESYYLSDTEPVVLNPAVGYIDGDELYNYGTGEDVELGYFNPNKSPFRVYWSEPTSQPGSGLVDKYIYIYNHVNAHWFTLEYARLYQPEEGYCDENGLICIKISGLGEGYYQLPEIDYESPDSYGDIPVIGTDLNFGFSN